MFRPKWNFEVINVKGSNYAFIPTIYMDMHAWQDAAKVIIYRNTSTIYNLRIKNGKLISLTD